MKSDLIYEITAACVALSVVVGAIVLSIVSLILRGQLTDPPGWLQTAVGAVIGFYFARRAEHAANGAPKVYNLGPATPVAVPGDKVP